VTGRLVYERKALGLAPTYQQLEWDGRDAEGSILANGVYLYRIFATNSASKALYEGRLVKLRKPRRVADDTTTP
jgi:flagellar hook assembly protein FlgD